MRILEKKPFLFVVALFFIYVIYVIYKRFILTTKEGFNDTPLNEIAQIIKGGDDFPNGTDITSILSRYSSIEDSQNINNVLSDIDVISNEINNTKKECENDICDNIPEDKINKLISLIKKMNSNIEIIMTASNISRPDKEILQENIDKIKGFEIIPVKI
jgi:hypothetical protein